MRIGKRSFPYPIINNDSQFSDFRDSKFSINFELNDSNQLIMVDKFIVLKNLHFQLHNDYLMSLYKEEKIKCYCVIESPASVYREIVEIKLEGVDYKIELTNLKNEVTISSFLIVNIDTMTYESIEFTEFFEDFSINLEFGSIIGVDDGYRFRVENDSLSDNKVESIFTIVRDDDKGSVVSYDESEDKIKIYISKDLYENYNTIKTTSKTQYIMFSMLLIPILSHALQRLQYNSDSEENFEDLIDSKRWLRSVYVRYEKVIGEKLEYEVFKNLNTFELAQELIDTSINRGTIDLFEIMTNNRNEEYDDAN